MKILGSETKRKIRSNNFALVGSEKFEAKRSEMHAKRIWFHFISLLSGKIFFGETGAP
jgi:hypothetical protein